jgi:hypothetical protein
LRSRAAFGLERRDRSGQDPVVPQEYKWQDARLSQKLVIFPPTTCPLLTAVFNAAMEKSSFMRVLGIFAIAIGGLAAFSLVGAILVFGMQAVIFVDGFASILLLVICSAVFWFAKIDWRRPEAAAIVVSFMSFVGMCVDSRGNPIYNLPLAWIFGSQGSQVKVNEIVSHGGGSTGVNYDFQIVSLHGAIEHSISGWLVMPMRFVEYLIVLSIAVTIITIIRNHSGRNWLPDNASD